MMWTERQQRLRLRTSWLQVILTDRCGTQQQLWAACDVAPRGQSAALHSSHARQHRL